MNGVALLMDTLSLTATVGVLLAVGWAAICRGAAHALWIRLRQQRRDESINWCMAMGTVVGCV